MLNKTYAAYLCYQAPFKLCIPEGSLVEVATVDPKSCIASLGSIFSYFQYITIF